MFAPSINVAAYPLAAVPRTTILLALADALPKFEPVPPYVVAIADPCQVPAVTIPFAKVTFEIFDVLVEGTFIVPPINALPANPKPPETTSAPEVLEVVAVVFDTNKLEKFDGVEEGT